MPNVRLGGGKSMIKDSILKGILWGAILGGTIGYAVVYCTPAHAIEAADFHVNDVWVARDGAKWRILATDAAIANYPIVAMSIADGKVHYFTAEGKAHINGSESPRDLIRKDVPSIKVTNWTIILRGTPAECTLDPLRADE